MTPCVPECSVCRASDADAGDSATATTGTLTVTVAEADLVASATLVAFTV